MANAMEQKFDLERVMGIEPTSLAWEAGILPMNYTRIDFYSLSSLAQKCKNLQIIFFVPNCNNKLNTRRTFMQ